MTKPAQPGRKVLAFHLESLSSLLTSTRKEEHPGPPFRGKQWHVLPGLVLGSCHPLPHQAWPTVGNCYVSPTRQVVGVRINPSELYTKNNVCWNQACPDPETETSGLRSTNNTIKIRSEENVSGLRIIRINDWFIGVLTPQQQPGSYQGGEMMMMKSVFWWRKPEYPEETTEVRINEV